ncbi:MAG: glycosyltransferase [Bacteroidia bacterium]|nr:glycosyltransferase [Bacteroidia bacterium]
MEPLVSVILPVYNASFFLKDSVRSILNQTYKNFELIIINDGSTDNSREILNRIKDNRIKFIDYDYNRGLIDTLNEGISLSKGKYLVRMDADDQSHPRRIEVLVNYMEANPNVGIAGSYTNLTGPSLYYKKKLSSDEIKSRLLFDNIFSHPTMIFRRQLFSDYSVAYNKKYFCAEDYGLWFEMMNQTDYGLVPRRLLHYGIHQNQVSMVFREEQLQSVQKIHREWLSLIQVSYDENEINLHQKIFHKNYEITPEFFCSCEKWLMKLISSNENSKFHHPESFKKIVAWVWFELATHLASHKISTTKIFKKSFLYRPDCYDPFFLFKYNLKNLLN